MAALCCHLTLTRNSLATRFTEPCYFRLGFNSLQLVSSRRKFVSSPANCPARKPRQRLCNASAGRSDVKHTLLRRPNPADTTDQGVMKDLQWAPTLATLAALGALLGPPMDGFHSNVDLLAYDKFALTIGTWKACLADAPLLALYYSVAGSLVLLLDKFWPSEAPPLVPSAPRVALQFGILAAFLQLSAVMYDNGLPYIQIWGVLGVGAAVGWRLTEGSKQALALGMLSVAVCPLAEALLMGLAGLWHYSRADLFVGGQGITSWVACCYAFYTVSLAPLTRFVAAQYTTPASEDGQ